MENSKPLVIVLSRNYSTGLGVIRSLGAAGYTVDLIASTKKKGSSVIASSSKYVRNSVEVMTRNIQGDTGKGLIDELMKYVDTYDNKKVLFPVDDFTTSVIDQNRELLKPYFYMPGTLDGTVPVNRLMDKTVQGKLAKEFGILTPAETLISLRGNVELSDDIVYPCFVKPLQSVTGNKTEMAVCKDREELQTHLCKMQEFYKDRDVLVQEYLSIDKEYDLSGVCVDQEIIIPAVIEKIRIARHELGVTMCGKLNSADILGDVKGKIIEFLKSIHYVGMFDMELNVCGDKIYFNEINFRSGGPNYSYYLNGVNLPEIFVKEITGKGHDQKEEVMHQFGKTFVYEKVAWEDYMNSYMTGAELKKCIKEADFTLLEDKSDPVPGKIFYKRIRMSAIKNKMKKIANKNNKEVKKTLSIEKKRIVVAGRNYCNILTMTRALGEAGYEVDVLRVIKKCPNRLNLLAKMEPDAYSQYVRRYYRCVVNDEPQRVVEKLTEFADKDNKTLLVPVDDYTACIIDEAYNKLSDYYIVPNVAEKEGEIVRLMDKCEQKKLAALQALPMLESVLIKSEKGEFEIPEEIPYPCFIKPNVSMNSTKSKMMKCNSQEELKNILSKYAQKEDFEMLVEEFADIKTEYSVLGISTPEHVTAPCVFKVLAGGHKERKGVTILGEAVDTERFQPMIEACSRFIRSLKYTGLFDIDLLETSDGSLYFIELNFRAGASTHLFTKTGVNLPAMFADFLIKNKAIADICTKECAGKKFVSEKVLLEEYVRNDVSISGMRNYLSGADVYFIKDDVDVKPYKYFRKYYLAAALFKIPYWLRDKRRK